MLQEKSRAPSGINRDLAFLRTAFNLAVSENFMISSPFDNPSKNRRYSLFLPVPKKDMEVLTIDELRSYFNAIPIEQDEVRTAFIIISYTACRRRSLAIKKPYWSNVMQWKDLNFDDSTIKIIQKGDHVKILPMHSDLRNFMLQKHMELRRPSGNILSISADTITRNFKKAYKKAGITKDLDPVHGIRHTAATRLLEAGCSLKDIAEILG